MALGYGGNTLWRDMSEYVVHLTGPGSPPVGRNTLHSILESKELTATQAYGAAWNIEPVRESQRVVSLSEIPLDHLGRLAQRHGYEGLALRKSTVRSRGGSPVWYLPRGTPPQVALFEEVRRLAFREGPPDPSHWIWQITPFIDYPGEYVYENGAPKQYEFTWEREWRVPSGFPFSHEEVVFLFAREGAHDNWQHAWTEMSQCPPPPMIDLDWSISELQRVAMREDL